MSWPSEVVPNQCAPEGVSRGMNLAGAVGPDTEVNSEGKTAITRSTKNLPKTTLALRLLRNERHTSPRPRRRPGAGAPAGACGAAESADVRVVIGSLPLRPGTR